MRILSLLILCLGFSGCASRALDPSDSKSDDVNSIRLETAYALHTELYAFERWIENDSDGKAALQGQRWEITGTSIHISQQHYLHEGHCRTKIYKADENRRATLFLFATDIEPKPVFNFNGEGEFSFRLTIIDDHKYLSLTDIKTNEPLAVLEIQDEGVIVAQAHGWYEVFDDYRSQALFAEEKLSIEPEFSDRFMRKWSYLSALESDAR